MKREWKIFAAMLWSKGGEISHGASGLATAKGLGRRVAEVALHLKEVST